MISEVLRNTETVRVLDFLLDDPLSQYTKKDIAEGSEVSRPTVDKILPDLLRFGVLKEVRKIGITRLYEMDVESPIVVSLVKFNTEIGKAFAERKLDLLNRPDPTLLEIDADYVQRKISHQKILVTGVGNAFRILNSQFSLMKSDEFTRLMARPPEIKVQSKKELLELRIEETANAA